MNVIADLQLHSKYARAVSKDMVVPEIAKWAEKKGIGLIATGDWMHPIWFRELKSRLTEVSDGIFEYKGSITVGRTGGVKVPEELEGSQGNAKFLLSAEISSIYTQGGKQRRVHTLVFSPNFSVCERINHELMRRGCNLSSDGRPIVGLSAHDVAEIALSISDRCLIIPAHAWTPWFSVYGANSGFDSLEECFGNLARFIYAVETGLSSDPAMNWSIKELTERAIVSFSDAHSGAKIGREATVFQTLNSKEKTEGRADETRNSNFTYDDIYWAIAERHLGENKGKLSLTSTIEFYPEEGKYHYSGHRKCGVVQSPKETAQQGSVCTVCGKKLTLGVMYRVSELARMGDSGGKENLIEPIKRLNPQGVAEYFHPNDTTRPYYVMAVPLLEVLAEVFESGVHSLTVSREYERLIALAGSEFNVLLTTPIETVRRLGGERLAEAIDLVRKGMITVQPGYDGVFGVVKIWKGESSLNTDTKQQMTLF